MKLTILQKTEVNMLSSVYPSVVCFSVFRNFGFEEFKQITENGLFRKIDTFKLITNHYRGAGAGKNLIDMSLYCSYTNSECYSFNTMGVFSHGGIPKYMKPVVKRLQKNLLLNNLILEVNRKYLKYKEENLFNILSTPIGVSGASSKLANIKYKREEVNQTTVIDPLLEYGIGIINGLSDLVGVSSDMVHLTKIIKELDSSYDASDVAIIMKTNYVSEFSKRSIPPTLGYSAKDAESIYDFLKENERLIFEQFQAESTPHDITTGKNYAK